MWGHYGIAREFAALAGRELKPLDVIDTAKYDNLPKVDMKIEDPLCQRYSCMQIENVSRNVSPVNMRIRLYYCGMRAINFLADLTNYLMLEMGQPMHAFDSRKVEKIRIKRFNEPFTFQTLDGVERNIDENTLMICSDNTPVAIAGIMGGLDSEIVDDTTTLTLESATFDAASIRKSTVRLSHRTDASMRYEKSLDPEMTTVAIARFVKLLQDSDNGVKVVSALTDDYAYHYPKVELEFDKAFVDKYTGINIPNETILKTLASLGFEASESNDNFSVVVPSWRATKDVTIKADIIEEITRIYGYDNFEINTANAPLYPVKPDIEKTVEDKIKDLLVKSFSLHELHSYVWSYYDELKAIGLEPSGVIKLEGATNPNIETIRDSIIPTQLCQIKSNTSFSPNFGIFEVGRVVSAVDENNLCVENKMLAVTLFSKTQNVASLYYHLRDILATMSDDIKHKPLTFEAKQATKDYQHPRNLNKIFCDGVEIGEIGIVHPAVSKKIDKKAAIVFAQIDVEKFAKIENASISYEEPSKFPEMEIDLSFVSQRFAPIAEAVKLVNSSLIKKIEVTDIYDDESDGTKSITTRLTFAHPEKTLTREEVQEVTDKIINALKEKNISLKG